MRAAIKPIKKKSNRELLVSFVFIQWTKHRFREDGAVNATPQNEFMNQMGLMR